MNQYLIISKPFFQIILLILINFSICNDSYEIFGSCGFNTDYMPKIGKESFDLALKKNNDSLSLIERFLNISMRDRDIRAETVYIIFEKKDYNFLAKVNINQIKGEKFKFIILSGNFINEFNQIEGIKEYIDKLENKSYYWEKTYEYGFKKFSALLFCIHHELTHMTNSDFINLRSSNDIKKLEEEKNADSVSLEFLITKYKISDFYSITRIFHDYSKIQYPNYKNIDRIKVLENQYFKCINSNWSEFNLDTENLFIDTTNSTAPIQSFESNSKYIGSPTRVYDNKDYSIPFYSRNIQKSLDTFSLITIYNCQIFIDKNSLVFKYKNLFDSILIINNNIYIVDTFEVTCYYNKKFNGNFIRDLEYTISVNSIEKNLNELEQEIYNFGGVENTPNIIRDIIYKELSEKIIINQIMGSINSNCILLNSKVEKLEISNYNYTLDPYIYKDSRFIGFLLTKKGLERFKDEMQQMNSNFEMNNAELENKLFYKVFNSRKTETLQFRKNGLTRDKDFIGYLVNHFYLEKYLYELEVNNPRPRGTIR